MQKKIDSFKIFLKMAAELDAPEPVVALCCRMYYLEKVISLKKQGNLPTTPEEHTELGKIFTLVDEAKKNFPMSKEETKDVLENFCGRYFATVNKDDLTAPKITKEHAVRFNKAAHFIELLSVYGGLTPKWEEKSNV